MSEFNLNIVLVAPEIPQNTGNIGRLCVNTNCQLHLIEPLGFSLAESRLRRAGLDYWPNLQVKTHPDWKTFLNRENPETGSLFFCSTRGSKSIYDIPFQPGSTLVFGNESSGLPPDFYVRYADLLFYLPMPGKHARSLNLANAVCVAVYEGMRQIYSW